MRRRIPLRPADETELEVDPPLLHFYNYITELVCTQGMSADEDAFASNEQPPTQAETILVQQFQAPDTDMPMTPTLASNTKVQAALITAQICFGLGGVISALGLPACNPFAFALYREIAAGALLLLAAHSSTTKITDI